MKRANSLLVIIIVFLTLVIIGLISLLVLTLLNIKEKPYEKEESVDKIVNGNVMSFLSTTTSISGDPYYNVLDAVDKTDEEVFTIAIEYLYANNMYTKVNDEYTFKQSDIINIAKKYMLKDEFNYITINPNYRYDENNKTFITKLPTLGLKAYILKSMEIYEKTETTASVILEIEGSYDINSVRIWEKYDILVDTKEDNYKITGITKIK